VEAPLEGHIGVGLGKPVVLLPEVLLPAVVVHLLEGIVGDQLCLQALLAEEEELLDVIKPLVDLFRSEVQQFRPLVRPVQVVQLRPAAVDELAKLVEDEEVHINFWVHLPYERNHPQEPCGFHEDRQAETIIAGVPLPVLPLLGPLELLLCIKLLV
jgi:hypothetical protein